MGLLGSGVLSLALILTILTEVRYACSIPEGLDCCLLTTLMSPELCQQIKSDQSEGGRLEPLFPKKPSNNLSEEHLEVGKITGAEKIQPSGKNLWPPLAKHDKILRNTDDSLPLNTIEDKQNDQPVLYMLNSKVHPQERKNYISPYIQANIQAQKQIGQNKKDNVVLDKTVEGKPGNIVRRNKNTHTEYVINGTPSRDILTFTKDKAFNENKGLTSYEQGLININFSEKNSKPVIIEEDENIHIKRTITIKSPDAERSVKEQDLQLSEKPLVGTDDVVMPPSDEMLLYNSLLQQELKEKLDESERSKAPIIPRYNGHFLSDTIILPARKLAAMQTQPNFASKEPGVNDNSFHYLKPLVLLSDVNRESTDNQLYGVQNVGQHGLNEKKYLHLIPLTVNGYKKM